LAIPTRYAPKRAHVPYWWFLATAIAAVIAIGPIMGALVATLGGTSVSRTAFASAPAGNYAVVVRPEADTDVVVVVPAERGAEESEIARVPRLPGYTAYGAVSPSGSRVAMVTADQGTQAHPVASLVVVDLETAEVSRLADAVDYLQTPVWAPDGASVLFTRSIGQGPVIDVDLVRAHLDSSAETVVAESDGVLGAYPVGFDAAGRLVHVEIDGRGSIAYQDGAEVALLAPGITRDWRLSPDGSTLAFVETSTASGVQYFARTAALNGADNRALSLTAADRQSLGVAWRPGSAEPTFGHAPGTGGSEGARALSTAGFDVPLAYSPDGRAFAVQHWSGASFSEPGDGELQIVTPGSERVALDGAARFYGWATR
jgi:hypothetical protein